MVDCQQVPRMGSLEGGIRLSLILTQSYVTDHIHTELHKSLY